MISTQNIYDFGYPRIGRITAIALKTSNVALHRGASQEEVEQALRILISCRDPLKCDLGKITPLFTELAAVLQQERDEHGFFSERDTPAPWKRWGDDHPDEKAIAQMKDACRLPVAQGGALMPDAHMGYGLPIGGVLAVRNAVIPYAVGVDIACRMRISVTDLPLDALKTGKDSLMDALESQTAFGVGAHFPLQDSLEHEVMELPDWQATKLLKNDRNKAFVQLGTSGSGNHFAEFGYLTLAADVNEPALKLKAGTYVALLTHSGSRGTGEDVASYYSDLARSLHPELPEELKHLSWLGLDSEPGQEYWQAMQLMGKYAAANHELIHERVLKYFHASAIGVVENHHNFAWKESYGGEELIVHRKGATPAGAGVLGVIPGSMASPAFVVRGKGNELSYRSSSHGAGRIMSRKAAFKTLREECMQDLLAQRGIDLISGTLDESPEVYRNIEGVMAAQTDLVDILARFDPKIVKMSGKYYLDPGKGFAAAAQ